MQDGAAHVVALLWGARAGPARGRRPSLTLDRIAAATVEIADAEGLPAVSMQRVAERLGVTKMALYRYLTAKAELLAVAVDAAQADPPDLGNAGEGWRPRLEWWTRLQRETWQRHPWLPAAVPGDRVLGPNELGWIDRAMSALQATDLDGPQRLDAVLLLAGQVRAAATGAPTGTQPWTSDGRTRPVLHRLIEERGGFPAVLAATAVPRAEGDGGSEFGLQVVLDGLAAAIRAADTVYEGNGSTGTGGGA
jgi:AcrR family transcriptional regulator